MNKDNANRVQKQVYLVMPRRSLAYLKIMRTCAETSLLGYAEAKLSLSKGNANLCRSKFPRVIPINNRLHIIRDNLFMHDFS